MLPSLPRQIFLGSFDSFINLVCLKNKYYAPPFSLPANYLKEICDLICSKIFRCELLPFKWHMHFTVFTISLIKYWLPSLCKRHLGSGDTQQWDEHDSCLQITCILEFIVFWNDGSFTFQHHGTISDFLHHTDKLELVPLSFSCSFSDFIKASLLPSLLLVWIPYKRCVFFPLLLMLQI